MSGRTALTRHGNHEVIPGVTPSFRARWDKTRLNDLDDDELEFVLDMADPEVRRPDHHHRRIQVFERRADLVGAEGAARAHLLEDLVDLWAMWPHGRSEFSYERGQLNRKLRALLEDVGHPATIKSVMAARPGVVDFSSAWGTQSWWPAGREGRLLLYPPGFDDQSGWRVFPETFDDVRHDEVVVDQGTLEQVTYALFEQAEVLAVTQAHW